MKGARVRRVKARKTCEFRSSMICGLCLAKVHKQHADYTKYDVPFTTENKDEERPKFLKTITALRKKIHALKRK